MTTLRAPELLQAADAIRSRQRFVLSSHARPDGDAIGAQLAMAFALRSLGKDVRIVNRDRAPAPLLQFAGVEAVEIADAVDAVFDAAIVMECGDLGRTGVAGLDRSFVINIDHHPGNTGYGQVNWFDASAAACTEMVFDLVDALGAPLSVDVATHIYLGILTDTGSFHFSHITPRTFDIARRTIEAGVDPVQVARRVFDSNSMGRLKLFGAVLRTLQTDAAGRVAVLSLDHAMAREAGGTYDDTEGLINEPLTVKDIQAVVFFKQNVDDEYRVSMRSKGQVDIGAVAKAYGGGGHKNAAGCTVRGDLAALQRTFVELLGRAVDAAAR